MIEENNSILKEIKTFYQQLYSLTLDDEETLQFEKYIDEAGPVPVLSEELKEICEGDLSVEECFNSLKFFKNNKSPGCDGLTIECYKTFWHSIGERLV